MVAMELFIILNALHNCNGGFYIEGEIRCEIFYIFTSLKISATMADVQVATQLVASILNAFRSHHCRDFTVWGYIY